MADKRRLAGTSRLLRFGPYLSWPLAIITVLLVSAAALAVTSVLASLDRGQPKPIWYAVAFIVAVVALTWWHHRNLDEYLAYHGARLLIAHIGGTFCVFVGTSAVLAFGLGFLIVQVFGWEGFGRGLFTGLITILMFPLSYFPGRFVANVLDGGWLNEEIQETDTGSRHYPRSQFRRHSPSDYFTIKQDHWLSFLLTWIPAVIGAVAACVVYGFVVLPSPAVARCMAAAEDSRWMVQDRPNPADIAAAVHWYSEAIQLDPNYAPAYLWRGHAYKQMGQNDLAKADYEAATRLDRDGYGEVLSSLRRKSEIGRNRTK